MRLRPSQGVLPGFGLSLGTTLLYLSLMVLLPLGALIFSAGRMGAHDVFALVAQPRSLAAFRLSFGAALLAAAIDAALGLLVAWVLARHTFPGRALLDAIVDLPFALPTAVAGIALTALYSESGWLGSWLARLGAKVAFAPPGVVIALAFVGLPFAVRATQPVLEVQDRELEEVAATLGATRAQIFLRVILPALVPSLLTGFALAFARALGEYGSVVFISGNMPLRTEVVPLLIVTKLEQYDYAGATAIASVMLIAALALLLAVNRLERWSARWRRP